jgi:hypothetical protein
MTTGIAGGLISPIRAFVRAPLKGLLVINLIFAQDAGLPVSKVYTLNL